MRPFEGIKIIDVTHVLAGPFAAYQLALLGADVIKVDHPRATTCKPGVDTEAVSLRLATHGVDVAVRDGALRISPSYYNNRPDIDRLIRELPK